MKRPLALLLILSVFGCYNTYVVPVEQLYNIDMRAGTEARLRAHNGDDVVLKPNNDITFETLNGQRTKLQLRQASVNGQILSGTVRSGAPVQVDLTQIGSAEITQLSSGKTAGLVAGVAGGVIAVIVAIIVVAAVTSPPLDEF